MGFKTITIKERVFREISKAKGSDESFSDFFERVIPKNKPDLLKYAGAWKDMSKEEEAKMRGSMKEFRMGFEKSVKERMARHKE